MTRTILLIGNDKSWHQPLHAEFDQLGYHYQAQTSVEGALISMSRLDPPDLILLDVSLPDQDSLAIFQMVRKQVGVPIVVLADQTSVMDQVQALETGADDYLCQPFTPGMVVARTRAILRRYRGRPGLSGGTRAVLVVGVLKIDPGSLSVSGLGQTISLPPAEFQILYQLAEESGHVVPINQLLQRIWQDESTANSHIVYVHICNLRRRLTATWPKTFWQISTVRGVGYKLEAEL